MSTTGNNGFLLLFSSDEWYKHLSLPELQQIINQNKAWMERLVAQGKAKGGQALAREGATIAGKNRRVVSDGPFIESKEAIGGTLLLDVATLEEAIAIARTSPNLRYHTTIEVRPIGDECPLNARARQLEYETQHATANA
jgi:hypothetical protein